MGHTLFELANLEANFSSLTSNDPSNKWNSNLHFMLMGNLFFLLRL